MQESYVTNNNLRIVFNELGNYLEKGQEPPEDLFAEFLGELRLVTNVFLWIIQNDMYKNLEHNVKYGVITAEMRFGVVNYKLDLSQEQKDLVLSIYSTFEIKIFNDFEMMKSDEIKKVERNSDEYDELFYKFISRNIDKYADDFNNRLKEYNLEITYFNIKR